MDRFEGATLVRLKGPHGKYLWAEEDQYTICQHPEDKNERALWRVERNNQANKGKTLRFKSCFDTYLAAMDSHQHGVSFLAFAGKKVAQMRPENVESTANFEWEPVIEQGLLKLKSFCGTYLRGNSHTPPWNDSVSHDLPRNHKHQGWLAWEVDIVRVPNITPLELVVGQIHLMEVPTPSAPERPKKSPVFIKPSAAEQPKKSPVSIKDTWAKISPRFHRR